MEKEPVDDPTLDLQESHNFRGEYWDVEEWYTSLEPITFKTEFISLRMKDIDAIIKSHIRKITPDDQIILEDIENRIDKIIPTFKSQAVFVRLSTLSPKDATRNEADTLINLLREDLQNHGLQTKEVGQEKNIPKEAFSTPETVSQEIISLNKCVYLLCKVNTGKDAMRLISNSDRVHSLLNRKREEEKHFRMSIVLREWMDFEPEFEFRCFISKGKITAITHYYKFLYVEEIVKNKTKIEKSMITFLKETVQPLVRIDSYVCDLVLLDRVNFKFIVVELNPYAENTSSGLFDWKNPDDHKILTGEKDFEFRILDKPKLDVRDELGYFGLMLNEVRPVPDESVPPPVEKQKPTKRRECLIS
jgi:hypothetical protein